MSNSEDKCGQMAAQQRGGKKAVYARVRTIKKKNPVKNGFLLFFFFFKFFHFISTFRFFKLQNTSIKIKTN